MRRWTPWRWQVMAPLLLGVSLAGTAGGCALVQADVADRARAALSAGGIEGVEVSARYRDVTLRGPADLRDRSMAAVEGVEAVRGARYAPTTQSPVAVAPVLGARYDGERMVLTGTVSSTAQRTAIADAARAGRPAVRLDDRLDVDADAPEVPAARLRAFTAVVTAIPAALRSGTASLQEGRLLVAGERRGAAKGALAAPLASATGAGLEVTDTTVAGAAPAAQPQAVQRKLSDLLVGTTIRFDTASADIRPESVGIVDRAAAIIGPALTANPVLSVRVEGHTDNVGDPTRNRNLSLRRARAVVDALAARGVSRSRLIAVGFGSSKPVATNSTEAGRLQNRRIAFRVLGG